MFKHNGVIIHDQGFYIGDHGWYDKRWMYWSGVEIRSNGSKRKEMAGAEIPSNMQRSLVLF